MTAGSDESCGLERLPTTFLRLHLGLELVELAQIPEPAAQVEGDPVADGERLQPLELSQCCETSRGAERVVFTSHLLDLVEHPIAISYP